MSTLSFDPGDSCGLSLWVSVGKDKGRELWRQKLSYEDFILWCDGELDYPIYDIDVIVVEDYTQRPKPGGMNAKGNKMKASQAIGTMRLFAKIIGAEIVMQQPAILNVAAMHSSTKVVGHYDDSVSAFLHGWWYWESQGVPTARLRDLNGLSKVEIV